VEGLRRRGAISTLTSLSAALCRPGAPPPRALRRPLHSPRLTRHARPRQPPRQKPPHTSRTQPTRSCSSRLPPLCLQRRLLCPRWRRRSQQRGVQRLQTPQRLLLR
jgi:hypothetical protein